MPWFGKFRLATLRTASRISLEFALWQETSALKSATNTTATLWPEKEECKDCGVMCVPEFIEDGLCPLCGGQDGVSRTLGVTRELVENDSFGTHKL